MGDQPQLKMHLTDFKHLPSLQDALKSASDCSVRKFVDGDEKIWVDVLNANNELGSWDMDRAVGSFNGSDRVHREGIHFAVCGGIEAATACIQLHDSQPDLPELGWVAARPGFKGRGLGRLVCLAVVHYMKELGFERCYLWTDDHRDAAIKCYLGLGFEPDMQHGSYPERWRTIYQRLGY